MNAFDSTARVCAKTAFAAKSRRPNILFAAACLATVLPFTGCGRMETTSSDFAPSAAPREFYALEQNSVQPSPIRASREGRSASGGMMGGMAVADRSGPGGPNMAEAMLQEIPGGAVTKSARADRKIIYTATVDLVTDDLNAFEPKLLAMIQEASGFVAETNQTGTAGGQRSATWKIRVPVDNYDGFLQKTRTLGEVRSVHVNSQDVTEEFVDVTARVNAKKVQEQRLIDLIKNATGNLEDVLKVEGELARVRSEIERMEGRLRFLKDQTDLTTVTVTVSEIKDYVPPEAPTFGTKITRTFRESTDRLQMDLGEFVLGLVAWAPFLPFYVAGWGLFLWLLWRVWRKIRPMLAAEFHRTIRPNPIGSVPARDDSKPEPN
ncbi:DUF4349 domain-containing protein [bacterium]|nr:DUF4349 domain-containing protein [bacterium]